MDDKLISPATRYFLERKEAEEKDRSERRQRYRDKDRRNLTLAEIYEVLLEILEVERR